MATVREHNSGLGTRPDDRDFVHQHIVFDYQQSRPTRTVWQAFNERTCVCRDYAHLAIAFCRCLNIPARYCTGYLGDIGMAPPYGVMDLAAWFDAHLGGRWYTFDARNNVLRTGRVLIARGRDAADVVIITTFGPNTLESFRDLYQRSLTGCSLIAKGLNRVEGHCANWDICSKAVSPVSVDLSL
jgi:transglutaminase-like putative cysteine protease